MPIHLTEPHPTPRRPVISTGRGGAGNYTRVPSDLTDGPTASGPASLAHLHSITSYSSSSSTSSNAPHSSRKYTSGRGGFGNMADSTPEQAIFRFDEELARDRRMQERAAPVYHHLGRGGAGNVASERGYVDGVEMGRGRSGRQGSGSSGGSGASESGGWSGERAKRRLEGAWSAVSKTLSRQ